MLLLNISNLSLMARYNRIRFDFRSSEGHLPEVGSLAAGKLTRMLAEMPIDGHDTREWAGFYPINFTTNVKYSVQYINYSHSPPSDSRSGGPN